MATSVRTNENIIIRDVSIGKLFISILMLRFISSVYGRRGKEKVSTTFFLISFKDREGFDIVS